MNRFYILILFIISLTFAQCQEKQKQTESKVSTKELLNPSEFEELAKSENAVLLDVRTQGEVDKGYIKGAVHIDYSGSNFKSSLAKLDKDKVYLVYCASGGRSRTAQKVMNELGFRSVFDLKGGIVAWQRDGKEVIK